MFISKQLFFPTTLFIFSQRFYQFYSNNFHHLLLYNTHYHIIEVFLFSKPFHNFCNIPLTRNISPINYYLLGYSGRHRTDLGLVVVLGRRTLYYHIYHCLTYYYI
eukprot:UN33809